MVDFQLVRNMCYQNHARLDVLPGKLVYFFTELLRALSKKFRNITSHSCYSHILLNINGRFVIFDTDNSVSKLNLLLAKMEKILPSQHNMNKTLTECESLE